MKATIRNLRDAFVASDPGLNRLMAAASLMIALGATVGAVYAFMHITHLLWIEPPAGHPLPPKVAALLSAQHRGITIEAMLLGGIVALLSAIAVLEETSSERLVTMVSMPVPLLATMAIAIELVPDHAAGLVVMAIVIGLGTYLRKLIPVIGPRAILYGPMMFTGYVFGFLANGALAIHQLPGTAAMLWFSVALNLVLKEILTRPLVRGWLRRAGRSFRAQSRLALAASVQLLDAAGAQERRRASSRLYRRLRRLNDTALLIDGTIGTAAPRLGAAASAVHLDLLEVELLIGKIARISERLASIELPAGRRAEVHGWFDEAARALRARPARRRDPGLGAADVPFESGVRLVFGDLPRSALVGMEAANQVADSRRHGLTGFLRLDAPAQAAIRITLAVGAAAGFGSLLSERRYYWAVIAVFVTYMGVNTAHEQFAKAIARTAGTVLGILIGSLLATAVGVTPWSIAVIIAALSIGSYLMKVNYGLFVIGITVTVSQLYVQLGEFSNHLLVLRLEETAIGAAIAAIAALVVFPVPTRRAAAIALEHYVDALSQLLDRAAARLSGDPSDGRLTVDARAVDHFAHQFVAASTPLRFGHERRCIDEHVALVTETADHARNIAAALDFTCSPDTSPRPVRAPALQSGAARRTGRPGR